MQTIMYTIVCFFFLICLWPARCVYGCCAVNYKTEALSEVQANFYPLLMLSWNHIQFYTFLSCRACVP